LKGLSYNLTNGVISIIKPPGVSSHDVVAKTRKKLNTRKVGHAGTLDPGASGVIVLGVGKGTKLLEYVQDYKKTYRAEITFGFETESGDLFGNVINTKEIKSVSDKSWESILKQFLGKQMQTPPMTSALKRDGVRLYKLARTGLEVKRDQREIEIFSIDLVSSSKNKIMLDIECSSGTYIRVLCEDIAKKSGNIGVMSFLLRTEIGPFNLNNSSLLTDNLTLQPMRLAVNDMPKLILDDNQLKDIKHGRFIDINYNFKENEIVALLDEKNDLVAISYYNQGQIKPKKVFIQ